MDEKDSPLIRLTLSKEQQQQLQDNNTSQQPGNTIYRSSIVVRAISRITTKRFLPPHPHLLLRPSRSSLLRTLACLETNKLLPGGFLVIMSIMKTSPGPLSRCHDWWLDDGSGCEVWRQLVICSKQVFVWTAVMLHTACSKLHKSKRTKTSRKDEAENPNVH